MHDHACRFVHHDQVVIFKNNVQRDVLGDNLGLLRHRHVNLEEIAFRNTRLAILGDNPIHPHETFRNQPRQPGSRQRGRLWHITRKRLIKTRWRQGRDWKAQQGSPHGRQPSNLAG